MQQFSKLLTHMVIHEIPILFRLKLCAGSHHGINHSGFMQSVRQIYESAPEIKLMSFDAYVVILRLRVQLFQRKE